MEIANKSGGKPNRRAGQSIQPLELGVFALAQTATPSFLQQSGGEDCFGSPSHFISELK
jgi:hypothetical protein